MAKRYLDREVGCVLRTEYYLLVRRAHPTNNVSHVGWINPRQRQTLKNHIVRWVSLRPTQPTFNKSMYKFGDVR